MNSFLRWHRILEIKENIFRDDVLRINGRLVRAQTLPNFIGDRVTEKAVGFYLRPQNYL